MPESAAYYMGRVTITAWETRSRLEKALDPAQLEKLEKRMEETREKIHKKLFPDG